MRVALLGGAGFLGAAVTRALRARDIAVRIVTRDATRVSAVPDVQVVEADVTAGGVESLKTATAECDAVVNLIGLLYESGASSTFERAHVGVARGLAQLTSTRVVQVSAIGANASSMSKYARTKAQAEALLPDAVILRPSIVYGPQDAFFNRFATMAAYSPVLPLVGGGSTRFQPVHVDDVAAAVVAGLDAPKGVYELGGKDVRSFKQLMQMVLRVSGRGRALLPLPFNVATVQGALFESLHAVVPAVPPLITRDQVLLLKTDNIVAKDARSFADLHIHQRGCNDDDIAYITHK